MYKGRVECASSENIRCESARLQGDGRDVGSMLHASREVVRCSFQTPTPPRKQQAFVAFELVRVLRCSGSIYVGLAAAVGFCFEAALCEPIRVEAGSGNESLCSVSG